MFICVIFFFYTTYNVKNMKKYKILLKIQFFFNLGGHLGCHFFVLHSHKTNESITFSQNDTSVTFMDKI